MKMIVIISGALLLVFGSGIIYYRCEHAADVEKWKRTIDESKKRTEKIIKETDEWLEKRRRERERLDAETDAFLKSHPMKSLEDYESD